MESLLENGPSDGNDNDKEDDHDFSNNDDDDDDDHEVHDDDGNDHGTDYNLDSNNAVDKEEKQPITQQNAWVRRQETSKV